MSASIAWFAVEHEQDLNRLGRATNPAQRLVGAAGTPQRFVGLGCTSFTINTIKPTTTA
jgi:hypothetical protein